MKEYQSTAIVEFYSGIIGLTEKQAEARRYALARIEPGRYRIKEGQKVCLKAGEVFKLGFDPDKMTMGKLKLIGAPEETIVPDYIETLDHSGDEIESEAEFEPDKPKRRGRKPKDAD
ncbi:MAG: hypothetical protein ACU83N_10045 [Gammaproteobacteria bacterium]